MNKKKLSAYNAASVFVSFADGTTADVIIRYSSEKNKASEIGAVLLSDDGMYNGKKVSGWAYNSVDEGSLPRVHIAHNRAKVTVRAPQPGPVRSELQKSSRSAPAWAEFMLRIAVKREHRDGIIGDLNADFSRYYSEKGAWYAYAMCVADVCHGLLPLISRAAVRLTLMRLGGSLLKWWGS